MLSWVEHEKFYNLGGLMATAFNIGILVDWSWFSLLIWSKWDTKTVLEKSERFDETVRLHRLI